MPSPARGQSLDPREELSHVIGSLCSLRWTVFALRSAPVWQTPSAVFRGSGSNAWYQISQPSFGVKVTAW